MARRTPLLRMFLIQAVFFACSTASAQTRTAGTPTQGTTAGTPTQGQTTAGTPTQGQTTAGTPTRGATAGMPSPGFRPAGTPSPGQRSAGNPFSTPTSNSTFSAVGSPPGNQTTPFVTSNPFVTGTPSTGFQTGFVPNTFFPSSPIVNYGGGAVLGPDAVVPGYFENPQAYGDLSTYGLAGATNVPNVNGLGTVTVEPGSLPGVAAVTSNHGSTAESNARIRLRVPPSAAVLIEGQYTTPSGLVREFVTPRIDSAQEYSYTVEARWTENGRDVVRSRKVTFFAGDRVTVDLLKDLPPGRDDQGRHQARLPAIPGISQPASLTGFTHANSASPTPPPGTSFDVATDQSAHDGLVIGVNGSIFSVRSSSGSEYEYDIQPGAQITCDNVICSLTDVKAGMRVRIMTKNNQLRTALRVEALARNPEFVARVR